MDVNERNELAIQFGNIASSAGKIIMAIRACEIDVHRKPDGSPVTEADLKAEQLIDARLRALMPGVAVIAEESFDPADKRPPPGHFLLVDPLDGTREFVSGETDFTVNIALIEHGRPIVGAIFAPALNDVYLAGTTALRAEVTPGETLPALEALTIISTDRPGPGMRAVASRSHMDSETEHWLARRPVTELRSAGSSLKFCLIARGDADVYPRLAPTMEWDTAAGHAILDAAGGCVIGLDGSPLRYGKLDAGLRNDGFIAWGREPRGRESQG